MRSKIKVGLMTAVVALLAISLVAISCAPSGVATPTAPGEVSIGTILVGINNDCTGPTAANQLLVFQAMTGVIEKVNAKGGIVYNDPNTGKEERVRIAYEWGDDKNDTARGAAIYKRIISHDPLLYFSNTSASTIALAEWFNRDKVVGFCMGCPLIARYPVKRYVFPSMQSRTDECATTIKWCVQDWQSKGHPGMPTFAFFTMGGAFGESSIEPGVEAYAKSLGVKIAGKWIFDPRATDLSTEFQAMVGAGVNYTYGNFVPPQFALVCKEQRRLGLEDAIKVITDSNAMWAKLWELAPEASQGKLGNVERPDVTEVSIPEVKRYVELLKNLELPVDGIGMFTAGHTEIAIDAMKKALETKGYPISADDLVEALERGPLLQAWGPHPKVYATPEDHMLSRECAMAKVSGAKYVIISDWMEMVDTRPTK